MPASQPFDQRHDCSVDDSVADACTRVPRTSTHRHGSATARSLQRRSKQPSTTSFNRRLFSPWAQGVAGSNPVAPTKIPMKGEGCLSRRRPVGPDSFLCGTTLAPPRPELSMPAAIATCNSFSIRRLALPSRLGTSGEWLIASQHPVSFTGSGLSITGCREDPSNP